MPFSFTDVDYTASVDDADERDEREHDDDVQSESSFAKTWEDDAKASGTSLEMGSDAYQNMVMAAHGLTVDEREEVLSGIDSWEQAVEPADESDQDEREVEYREDIQDDREELEEQPALDGSFVDGDRRREQMFDFAKQVELKVARQVLEDAAQAGYGHADDALAQERLAELEGDVRKLSVKDIQDSVVSTLEAMDDVSDQEYNQDAGDYEFGF